MGSSWYSENGWVIVFLTYSGHDFARHSEPYTGPASITSTGGTRTSDLATSSVPNSQADILELDDDNAAPALLFLAELRGWLVHAAHQRMRVGVQREHRVPLDHLPSGLVGPSGPQPGQARRRTIGAPEDFSRWNRMQRPTTIDGLEDPRSMFSFLLFSRVITLT